MLQTSTCQTMTRSCHISAQPYTSLCADFESQHTGHKSLQFFSEPESCCTWKFLFYASRIPTDFNGKWMFRSVQIFTCAESNVSHHTSSITEILQKMAQRYFKCKTFSYIHLWHNIPLKCINYPWVEELDRMHYIFSYVFLEYFSCLFMTRILFRNTVITQGWIVFWLQHHSTIYPT